MASRPRLALTIVMAALAVTTVTAPAHAADAETIARVKLEGTRHHPVAGGTAGFVVYPRHSEIDLRVHGLPRSRHPVFVAWLIDQQGNARIAGGFPRGGGDNYSGSLIVPGPRREGEGKLREAKRMIITKMSRKRAFRTVRKARDSHWRKPLRVRGDRLMSGRAEHFAPR